MSAEDDRAAAIAARLAGAHPAPWDLGAADDLRWLLAERARLARIEAAARAHVAAGAAVEKATKGATLEAAIAFWAARDAAEAAEIALRAALAET